LSQIVSRRAVAASPLARVADVARTMADRDVGSVVVVRDRRPIGIVTDRDLTVRVLGAGLDPETTSVQAVMTTPVSSVRDDAPPGEAAALMRGAGVRRLAVVDEEGRLVGIVSLDDLLPDLAKVSRELGALMLSPPAGPEGR
jgi:CBS domain-containing protein